MKPCPFCAAEIKDDAIYCDHCGKKLDTSSAPAAPEQKGAVSQKGCAPLCLEQGWQNSRQCKQAIP
jgi:hypothetical protein